MKHKSFPSQRLSKQFSKQAMRITRREFIKKSAAAGMMMGLPPLLLSCGGSSQSANSANGANNGPNTETRTLFFNLAHENDPNKSYFLVAGGRDYPLTRVVSAPDVLAKVRTTNAFLRGVPDHQITHHVENVILATGSVTMCYLGSHINQSTGTWSMSMMHLLIPNGGADSAFAKMDQPIPLSNKRAFYGHGIAQSAQDLQDENTLVDSHDHATTLVMLHPGLLSADPDSAQTIYTKHAGTGISTKRLASVLQILGPAMPQQTSGQPNKEGWATMQPLLNAQGAPLKNSHNSLTSLTGLIQYFPDWHPSVDQEAAQAMQIHINNTRNDASLGTTITRGSTPSPSDLRGKIWLQREGFTTVNPDSKKLAAVGDDNVAMTLTSQSPEQGFDVTATFSQDGKDIKANLNLSNSYLRHLTIWLQFLDDSNPPNVIPLNKIASYRNNEILEGHGKSGDTANEMFATAIEPEFTLFGLPVAASEETLTITVPEEAHRVRILASGLSFAGGPNPYSQTVIGGAALTATIEYGLITILLAAGATERFEELNEVILPVLTTLAEELASLFASINVDNAEDIKEMGITLLKNFIEIAADKVLGKIVLALAFMITEDSMASCIPVAGQVMRALACAVALADLLHTTFDLNMSPWTYVKDLVFTHDLTVALSRDPKDLTFPKAATQYTATAMFEDGTPYVLTFPITVAGPATLPPVVFNDVPLGGKVNVSVAFSQPAQSSGGQDILLGKGSTGLVDNVVGARLAITIEELQFPIGPNTFYQHQQKTALAADPNSGQPIHVWLATKTAPTTKTTDSGNLPGDLSFLESITVRQGTSNPPVNGYIGYSWRSFSSGVVNCNSGAASQSDQLANLNTLTAQAQTGYVNNGCGLPSGAKLAYSLLSHGSSNFYLDTSNNFIRRVQLDPTSRFDDPASNQAWGKLNFVSNALLLHPAGKIISISTTDHQMESLKLGTGALPDAQAATQLLANRHAGEGKLPGLLSAPVAAAISPEGVVIILEQGNNRLQAFDVNGNPVSHFSQQSTPYFLPLNASGDAQYLDVAVEYTGFLYVLSVNNATGIFQMDIYHPKQSGTAPISTTQNVNAGRLTVDFWRNVYTLNFEVLQFNGAIPAVTEPSVSLWTPCIVGNVC